MSLPRHGPGFGQGRRRAAIEISSDRNYWTQQWYWRPSNSSYNGLEATWVTTAPRGSHDYAEARVFQANGGPYRGQWRPM